MKPLVILVHGMGTHKKGNIKKEFITGVNETGKCLINDSFKIEDHVKLKEYHYSKMLDDIRKKLSDNATAIKEQGFGFLSTIGVAGEVITAITDFHDDLDDDSFFTTHWLDVILYGSTFYGEQIRVEFAKFLNKELLKANGREIHIICHSLGTAVVHDTLAKLYRKSFNATDNIPDLPTGSFNISSLWTFANVSRLVCLLNDLEDPMTSPVTTGSDGCTNAFYNVRHKFDPFTWFKTYNRKMSFIKTYENDVIKKWNTHDFTEYVSDPLVTKRLINLLTSHYISNSSDDESKLGACIESHSKDTINEAYIELKILLERYKDKDKKYHSFREIYSVINKVITASAEFKKDME